MSEKAGGRRYRKAMFKAIEKAAAPGLFVKSSRSDGLRAIRTFETVNGCVFDPLDESHVQLVTNMGWFFRLKRKLAAITKDTP